MSNKLKTL